jgi:monoamine oxidase
MTNAATSDLPTIAIAGGGIGGLYAAYLLGRNGFDVTLYEQDERLGGRIETVKMPPDGAFLAEFGPMRFEPGLQLMLVDLVRHLGLRFQPFAPTTAPVSPIDYEEEDVEDFENTAHLLMWAVLRMFYDDQLDAAKFTTGPEQLMVLRGILDSHLSGSDYEADQAYLDSLRQTARLRGRPNAPLLRDLGLWNALAEFVSPGALTRIRDGGTFYHFLQHNPSAVEWGIFWLRQASDHGDEIETIAGGVGGLVDALEARIKATCGDRVRIVCAAKVVALENDGGVVVLTVQQGDTTRRERVGHVVLAIPQASLGEVASSFPPAIRDGLDAIMPLPLLKCFLVTDKPWWKPHTPAQSHSWLAPTRELHYFTYPEDPACKGAGACTCRPSMGMVMLYTDVPAIEFWKGFIPPGEQTQALVYDAAHPEPGGELLKRALVRHLLVEANPNIRAKIDMAPRYVARVLKERNEALHALMTERSAEKLSATLYEYACAGDRTPAELAALGAVLTACFRTDEDWVAALRASDAPLPDEELVELELPHVVSYGIRDWSRRPYVGAAHVWRPGTDPVGRGKELRAFSLEGGTAKNVHICGEAYSDFQGFIEGALRSARQVCDEIAPGLDWTLKS